MAIGCIMLLAFLTPLCKAASKSRLNSSEAFRTIDSRMRDALSDSIASIVLNADKITVSILKKDSIGNFAVEASKVCNKEQKCVLKFAMAASHFESAKGMVFGRFTPYIKVEFAHKKQQCILVYDLGLKQIKLMNEKEEELYTLVILDNQMIKAFAIFFPNDEFINFILKQ